MKGFMAVRRRTYPENYRTTGSKNGCPALIFKGAIMSKDYNEMATLKRKVKSMTTKMEALEQECTERGIELTLLNDRVERLPMDEPVRMLLQQPLKSYLKRCAQGKKGKK